MQTLDAEKNLSRLLAKLMLSWKVSQTRIHSKER